jgi:hypothetical protein
MFDELKKYKNNGHFFFSPGQNLKEVSKNVPDLPGVYYIMRLSRGKIDLVYIGKSGTMVQKGDFKSQLLRGRINNEQEGLRRQDYFEQKCKQENIEALDIYWFVTFDKVNQDLPGYIEGILIQRFFEVHGCLPLWNKEY